MKTKADIRKQIEALEEEMKTAPDGRCRDKDGWYYYIDSIGAIQRSRDTNRSIDNHRHKTGNYFRTYEEALEEKKYLDFEGEVRARFKELGGGKFIHGKHNYVVDVLLDDEVVETDFWQSTHSHQRGWVAQDESIVKQIITEFDFLAYAKGEL